LYEAHLASQGVSEATLAEVERRVTEEVDRAAEEALESRESNMPPPDSAMDDVYAS
jgi:TPP-dependent pyruvate/acetoin dehydrogenase alpha subunit